MGCTFANVLFVTEDALSEFELKAVSWFWSVVQADLPKVNEQRLASVGAHLIGDEVDPAHVFLTVEAFKMIANISVISDLDMLMLNASRLAATLHTFVTDPGLQDRMQKCGNVAVMHRADSRMDFDAPLKSRPVDWES